MPSFMQPPPSSIRSDADKAAEREEDRHIRRMQLTLQLLLTCAVLGTFWITLHSHFKKRQ